MRTRIQLQLGAAYSMYIKEMNEIYDELFEHINYITENYNNIDVDLILEGFWDTLKGGAEKTGKFIGKGVKKAKELGTKAVEVTQNLMNSIKDKIVKVANYIKSAPGKTWDYLVNDVWTPLKDFSQKVYADAKEKGEQAIEIAKENIKKAYDTTINGIKNAFQFVGKWIVDNKNDFVAFINNKAGDIKNGINGLIKSGNAELVKLGEWWKKNWNKIKVGAGNAALITLGLAVMPLYLTYKGGEGGINALTRAWDSIKTNAPEVYSAFKKGYQEGVNPDEVQSNERRIMTWETFLNEKKKECEKDKEEKDDKKKKPMSKKQAAFFKKMGWDPDKRK